MVYRPKYVLIIEKIGGTPNPRPGGYRREQVDMFLTVRCEVTEASMERGVGTRYSHTRTAIIPLSQAESTDFRKESDRRSRGDGATRITISGYMGASRTRSIR
jgi:hypothetical protein